MEAIVVVFMIVAAVFAVVTFAYVGTELVIEVKNKRAGRRAGAKLAAEEARIAEEEAQAAAARELEALRSTEAYLRALEEEESAQNIVETPSTIEDGPPPPKEEAK